MNPIFHKNHVHESKLNAKSWLEPNSPLFVPICSAGAYMACAAQNKAWTNNKTVPYRSMLLLWVCGASVVLLAFFITRSHVHIMRQSVGESERGCRQTDAQGAGQTIDLFIYNCIQYAIFFVQYCCAYKKQIEKQKHNIIDPNATLHCLNKNKKT